MSSWKTKLCVADIEMLFAFFLLIFCAVNDSQLDNLFINCRVDKNNGTAAKIQNKCTALEEQISKLDSDLVIARERLRFSEDDINTLERDLHSMSKLCWSTLKNLQSDACKISTEALKMRSADIQLIERLLSATTDDSSYGAEDSDDDNFTLFNKVRDYLTESMKSGELVDKANTRIGDRVYLTGQKMFEIIDRLQSDADDDVNRNSAADRRMYYGDQHSSSLSCSADVENMFREYVCSVQYLRNKLDSLNPVVSSKHDELFAKLNDHIYVLTNRVERQHSKIAELENTLQNQVAAANFDESERCFKLNERSLLDEISRLKDEIKMSKNHIDVLEDTVENQQAIIVGFENKLLDIAVTTDDTTFKKSVEHTTEQQQQQQLVVGETSRTIEEETTIPAIDSENKLLDAIMIVDNTSGKIGAVQDAGGTGVTDDQIVPLPEKKHPIDVSAAVEWEECKLNEIII